MIASMTGFGRAMADGPNGKIVVEVQSVNRKYLEVFVSLPKELNRFEHDVRKMVGDHVLRGQVSVKIHLLPHVSSLGQSIPDLEVLRSLKHGWEQVAVSLGYDKKCIDLPFLMQHIVTDSKTQIGREEDFEPIAKCLQEALQQLKTMKEKEGVSLVKDIEQRLNQIAYFVADIESAAPEATAKMRKKLKDRMEEIFQPSAELDERLMREVALFAERVDISEEITRLVSHLSQYKDLLKNKVKGSGRKMDFLVQEMGREINTIGSKSMEAKIAHLVVDMKSELEKIREQIQNIE